VAGGVGEKVEAEWARLVAEAEDEILGGMVPLPYVTFPRWLAPPARAPPAAPVTLVTQCSPDRLPRLAAAIEAWRGPVSAAIYVDAPAGSAAAAQAEADFRAALRHLSLELASQLTVSLLYQHPPPLDAAPGSAEEYATLYPINALRNLAVDSASTDLVFLLDTDFVPSAGLLTELTRCRQPLLHALSTTRTAAVVPAFEVDPAHPLPHAQASLASLAGRAAASPFHVGHFPRGHGPTDAKRWMSADQPYQIQFQEYYEPYIIASRRWLPRLDERFRGYGMNKVSHLYAVAAAGALFLVLPTHFMAAHEHPKSGAWHATVGPHAHPAHTMRIAALYRRFKAEAPPLAPAGPPAQPLPLLAQPLLSPAQPPRAPTKRSADAARDASGDGDGAAAKRSRRMAPSVSRLPRRGRHGHTRALAIACRG
jgi:glycosyltransferase-like protein LARGE